MAVRVENKIPTNRNDFFKITCRRCGREISYNRKDVLSHRRWPNGFIYCPVCKTPNGHREDNLVETGDVFTVKEAQRQYETKKIVAEQYNKEDLEKEINSYSKQKKVLFALGIPLMAVGLTLAMIFTYLGGGNPQNDNVYYMLSTVASLIFGAGLVLFIISLALVSKIKKRRELLQIKKDEEQKQINKEATE